MVPKLLFFTLVSAAAAAVLAEEPFALKRCELIPLAQQQVSFQVDGVEKTRWHFGAEYPRPFFFPFNGPSGVSLTRMGHPGAQNHDHHRSVWFAHKSVDGHDFWSDGKGTQVRQRRWYRYRDGAREAVMATSCIWYDPTERPVLEQELVAALIPLARNEHALEVQITMQPGKQAEMVRLDETNFGFLAVRVAKTLSVYFGGGQLTSSEGQEGEPEIFGKRARWMDYSGPVAVGRGADRKAVIEGITYFDHPANPRYPSPWHVREDGWMGASFCMYEGYTIARDDPLTLRYLLHAHAGAYHHGRAEQLHDDFAARPGFAVTKATKRHRQYEVERIEKQ